MKDKPTTPIRVGDAITFYRRAQTGAGEHLTQELAGTCAKVRADRPGVIDVEYIDPRGAKRYAAKVHQRQVHRLGMPDYTGCPGWDWPQEPEPELEELTRDELTRMATEAGIADAGKMKKSELLAALGGG